MAASTGKTPRTYAEAVDGIGQAQQAAAKARLRDPDEHFDYKTADARRALEEPPDPDTNNHPGHWYTSAEIIAASEAYVQAQKAHLADLGDADAKAAYVSAAEALVDARRAHRVGRPVGPVAVAGHPEEIERRRSMIRVAGRAGFTPEEIAVQFNRSLGEVQGALYGLED